MHKFFFPMLLFSSVLFSQDILTNPNEQIAISLSSREPTRLAFDNQRIVDLFVYPKEGSNVVLHQSGFLFVLPQNGTELFLTLIGELGAVQDLHISFGGEESSTPVRLCVKPIQPNKE